MKIYIEKYESNIPKLVEEIGSLNEAITSIKGLDDGIDFFLKRPLTQQEMDDLSAIVAAHDPSPVPQLRIYKYLPRELNPLISDFSILGLKKIAPHYDRGRKVKAEYWDPSTDDIIIKKTFSDTREDGRLAYLSINFEWYDEAGNIALEKAEVVKSYNKAQAETEERKRRERSIDFLISEVRDTPYEPFIQSLMDHYHVQQVIFRERGSSEFADAINAETNPSILGILGARVPFASDNNFTIPVKESILYQINALDEQALADSLLPA